MSYEYFLSLTVEDAREYFENFLRAGRESAHDLVSAVEADGVVADFSVASVPGVIKWMLPKVRLEFTPLDDSVPQWIRGCDEHKHGQSSIHKASRPLVTQVSYYLGESFVQECPVLSWSMGNAETALEKMPVVTGFSHNMELPAILVVENLCRGIVKGTRPVEAIEQAISSWQKSVPQENS